MDELVHLGQGVLVRAGSQVARLVEVEVLLLVDEAQDADVKLATVEKQRPLDVLLNDYLFPFREHDVVYKVLPRANDFNASSTILVLRLDDPNVLGKLPRW